MTIPLYTMNQRALERWRDGRLTLQSKANEDTEASFRFEGSTCGNVPMTMVYHVTLGPPSDGYLIKAMGCHPLAGTDGHERMCSYINTDGRILEIADNEKPLLGQPLDAVLTWRPKTLPAGCLCTPSSRDHKWLAVLQTLHFTLNPPSSL